MTSVRKNAFETSFYSEAHSSSLPSILDPVDDVDWMWSGVEDDWSEDAFSRAATKAAAPPQLSSSSTHDAQSGAAVTKALDQTSPEREIFANYRGVSGEVSYFPSSQADDSAYDTTYHASPEFELHKGPEDQTSPALLADDDTGVGAPADPFSQDALSSRGAGGRKPRPILTCPMSSLPVLPLRAPREQDEPNGPNPLLQDDLVSIGGVGGFGLGSHSIIDQRYLAATIGVPLIEGMIAYRQGHYEVCVDKLLPLRSVWHHIGGSHAQLDVLSQTLEAAATQSKQLLLARALLRERLTLRPNSGLAMYHLSSVLYGTGEYRKAAQARDRALRLGLGEERISTPQVNAMTRTDEAWHE